MAIVVIDSGTTSTRAFVMDDGRVLGEASGMGGARDLARSKDRDWLATRVAEIADEALHVAAASWDETDAVVAFGMISSELGLEEVPHLEAPVDATGLASSLHRVHGDGRFKVPFYLVPGVRYRAAGFHESDFMRGEETEVVGLLHLGRVTPPFLLISTGSHTKFVSVGEGGSIEWSSTTLSGELLWALHRETIIAELVDPAGPIEDLRWVRRGALLVEEVGFARALFAARLLNRIDGESPGTCSDLIHGVVAMADLAGFRLLMGERQVGPARVVVTGSGSLARAYEHLLQSEWWVAGVERTAEPLGALGAWSLYRAREEMAA